MPGSPTSRAVAGVPASARAARPAARPPRPRGRPSATRSSYRSGLWREGRQLSQTGRGPVRAGTQPPVQGGVLDEHRLLEVAQLVARVEAELVGQDGPDLAQRCQRLGLPSGAGQGERVQRPDAFAERVPRRRLLGRGHDHRVVAEGEQAQDARLLGVEPELVERRPLEDHLRLVGEVGVRVTGPQGEQLLDPVHAPRDLRAGRPVGARPGGELRGERRERPVEGADLVGEAVRVDVLATERQPVAVVAGQQDPGLLPGAEARLEDASYAGEVGVQGAVGARGARPRPRPAAPARRAGRRCRAGGPARPGPSAACGRRRPRWLPDRRRAPPGSFRARGPTRAAT